MRYSTTCSSMVVGALLIGWFSGRYYHERYEDTKEVVQLRENSSEYRFINPLILVSDTRDMHFEKYDRMKSEAASYIKDSLSNQRADDISFYFRDLNGGEWLGVDENDKFAPASMLKVGTLMAYLKLADKAPSILLERAYYEPTDSGQYYKPELLSPGWYTVKELMRQMIVQSDNDAMRALHKLHIDEVGKIYDDLELREFFSDEVKFMSPREYSRFFRTLYNGAYISHLHSDEALDLLSLTQFEGGIRAGVGNGIAVSDKFGEYNYGEEKELHDCGIVYYPGRPYFVCVMTRGKDYEQLSSVIAHLSQIVYENIKKIE